MGVRERMGEVLWGEFYCMDTTIMAKCYLTFAGVCLLDFVSWLAVFRPMIWWAWMGYGNGDGNGNGKLEHGL